MKGKVMTEGSPWKHIIKFMVPVFLGALLQQLYSTVDNIIVGNYLGEDALSAVGTTGSFAYLCLALALGLSAGSGVVISQYFGAGKTDMVRRYASTGIILLMGIGVIMSVVAAITARPAYQYIFHVPDTIISMTVQYFTVYSIGLIFQYGYNIFSAILRAVGDSKATLYFLIISSIANVCLDLLFVTVFNWGVIGAAFATDIAQMASFMAAYVYMIKKYPVFRFKLKEFKLEGKLAVETIGFGIPIAIQQMIIGVGLMFIQRAVNELGSTMMASFTVGHRVELYIGIPTSSLQTTMATYTGQNIGAGKIERVKKGTFQGILISLMLTITISVLCWIFAAQVARVFGLNQGAADYCIENLRVICLVIIVFAMYVPLFGVFQGTNHPLVPMIVSVFSLGFRVASVYLLRNTNVFGYTIIWWNGLFGYGFGVISCWSYFLSGRWKKNSNRTINSNKVHS